MNISVVIPTYRNTKGLIKNLKHNMPYFAGCEVIVVNDNPDTSIVNDLLDFPDITLLENKKNLGFAGAVNKGIYAASGTYVFLCNDDVLVNDTNYTHVIKHFTNDPNLFAVTFMQKEKDGKRVGKNRIFWNDGFAQHSRARDLDDGISAWAEGGSSMVDVAKFDTLGGFDKLYAPFYWEDIDLSYRAWKRGYHILFTSQVEVIHHHETTIGTQFSRNFITSIAYRNQLIFIWKNISSPTLIFSHKIALLKHVILSILKRDRVFLSGFMRALALFPIILIRRFGIPHTISDHEIFNKFR